MEEIIKQLSTEDLIAFQNKDFASMSTEGLQLLHDAQQKVKEPERFEGTWTEAGISGVQELPSSTVNVGADILEALMTPIETGKALLGMAEGGIANLLPDNWADTIDEWNLSLGLPSHAKSQEMADAVGAYFVDKYKDGESIRHVIATDPASVLLDIGTVLTGGGMAVAKVGTVSKISNVTKTGDLISKTGSYVDPISASLKATLGIGNVVTKSAREGLGVTTGAGAKGIQEAFDSGTRGGRANEQFLAHIRGGREMNEVLDIALADLNVLKKQKLADYKANSAKWKKDKTVLDFADIDAAIIRAEKLVKYKGKVKNPEGAKIIQEIKKVVDEWKKFDPTDFHTPEGLDALKQRIWSVMEGVDRQSRTAQSAANAIYNSTKETIKKQAPGYAQTMKEYADATELILEIERTLSLGKKASPDTAIRKLQAIMRNNVSTNYGQRLKLADELQTKGGEMFMPGIAGQQLQSLTPQSLQKTAILPAAAVVSGNPLAIAATLAASSPRMVGELANKLGSAKRIINRIPVKHQGIQALLEVLYQVQATQK